MLSQFTNVTDGRTDRQTTCDRNTALCTKVHRSVISYKYNRIQCKQNNNDWTQLKNEQKCGCSAHADQAKQWHLVSMRSWLLTLYRLVPLQRFFYARQLTCYSAYMLSPSVCPSVCPPHGWIIQKRLNLGLWNFHHTVAIPLVFCR